MELHGGNILGADVAKSGAATFRAVNPSTGQELDPVFHEATEAEAARTLDLAEEAFAAYRSQPAEAIAKFLEAIAAGLEALGQELIARAHAETALPEARLLSERGRTVTQLRMFAALVCEGSWVDARIDRADPGRTPVPKPDLRRMLVPIGPVVVFGASNFPLALRGRYRLGIRRGQPGGRQGPSGSSRHIRISRPRDPESGPRLRIADGHIFHGARREA